MGTLRRRGFLVVENYAITVPVCCASMALAFRHEADSRIPAQVRRHARDLRGHLPRVRRRVRARADRGADRAGHVRGGQSRLPGSRRAAPGTRPGHTAAVGPSAPLPARRLPGRRRAARLRADRRRVDASLQAPPALRRGRPRDSVRAGRRRQLHTGTARGGSGEAYFRLQGFQLVPAEPTELWAEIRSLRLGVFLPWFLAAMAIKLVGIFANVLGWQLLLRGQGIDLGFGFLTRSYFIGRYFGIVTPSTMGLDAWRLYDTIRLTRRPVECTTVLGVERVIGMVGLFAVILLFMPFAGRITHGASIGEFVAAMKLPLAATAG